MDCVALKTLSITESNFTFTLSKLLLGMTFSWHRQATNKVTVHRRSICPYQYKSERNVAIYSLHPPLWVERRWWGWFVAVLFAVWKGSVLTPKDLTGPLQNWPFKHLHDVHSVVQDKRLSVLSPHLPAVLFQQLVPERLHFWWCRYEHMWPLEAEWGHWSRR